MNLVPNAGEVAAKSWAVRFALIAATLTAIAAAVPNFPPEVRDLPYFEMGVHWLSVASGIASAIARVITQPNMQGLGS